MTRTAFSVAVLVAASAARAQPAPDPWPLVPGNQWTFVTSYGQGSWAGGGEASLIGAFTWTAVDSVDTPGGRLPSLRRGTEAGPAECVVRTTLDLSGGTLIELLDPASAEPCAVIVLRAGPYLLFPDPVEMQPVVVGGEALGELPVAVESFGPDGHNDWYFTHRFAEGLGPLEFQNGMSHNGVSTSWTDRLRRATIGGVAVGQPLGSRADFWPLEAGNRWEFRLTDQAGVEDGAVAWTAVADGASVGLRLDRYADGAVVSTVTCPLAVVPPTAESAWQTTFSLECTLPDPLLFPSRRPDAESVRVDVYTEDVDVTIGATTVAADVAVGRRERGGGSQAPDQEASAGLAREIGPWWWAVRNPTGAPPGTYRRAALGYARVGGTEYGQHVVGADGAPEATALALAVAPNPAARTAHVRFSLAAAKAVRLDVVDALGRRVAGADLGARPAGPGEAVLDVSRLAPGPYTVRLSGGDAVATARLSVVR